MDGISNGNYSKGWDGRTMLGKRHGLVTNKGAESVRFLAQMFLERHVLALELLCILALALELLRL